MVVQAQEPRELQNGTIVPQCPSTRDQRCHRIIRACREWRILPKAYNKWGLVSSTRPLHAHHDLSQLKDADRTTQLVPYRAEYSISGRQPPPKTQNDSSDIRAQMPSLLSDFWFLRWHPKPLLRDIPNCADASARTPWRNLAICLEIWLYFLAVRKLVCSSLLDYDWQGWEHT